jgi:hypothetical protein
MSFDNNFLNFVMVTNAEFEPLARNACNSLYHPRIRIHLLKLPNGNVSGEFGSSVWYDALKTKICFFNYLFQQLNDGQILGCSDSDIQFYKPNSIYHLKYLLEKHSLLYLGQNEGCEQNQTGTTNGGFFLAKKSSATSKMFEYISTLDFKRFPFAEQTIINEILSTHTIPYQLLPPDLYLTGGCIFQPLYLDPSSAIMYHANCCSGLLDKKKNISKAGKMMGLPEPNYKADYHHNVIHYSITQNSE